MRTFGPTAFSRPAVHAGFVVSSLTCILLAHYAAVLPHEYAHSFMAFALGYKSDPLVIHFGGTSVGNLISLINIDEQVDYAPMFARVTDRLRPLSASPARDWPTARCICCRSASFIPIMLIVCWPSRRWMRARVEAARDPTD